MATRQPRHDDTGALYGSDSDTDEARFGDVGRATLDRAEREIRRAVGLWNGQEGGRDGGQRRIALLSASLIDSPCTDQSASNRLSSGLFCRQLQHTPRQV